MSRQAAQTTIETPLAWACLAYAAAAVALFPGTYVALGTPYAATLVRTLPPMLLFGLAVAAMVARPAAPFAYTNNYGSAYALTLPCVVALVMLGRRGLFRTLLLVSLPLSLPPAFLTLNRGMFLSVGVGLAFLGVRATLRIGSVRLAPAAAGPLARELRELLRRHAP